MNGDLANHLWQSTMFAVAAGLLTIAFRRNQARVRYWVWFSASVKFVVPFALLMSLGSRLEWATAARELAPPALSLAMVQVSQPFFDTVQTAAPSSPSTTGGADWLALLLLALWVSGAGALACIRWHGWRRVRAAVRVSRPFTIPGVEMPANVQVRSAPGLIEPGVVGFRQPILLMPQGLEDHLTPRQLEAVVAHELCHVRRRDNLTSAMHMVVEAVFWFHPLVWWIGARLVDERERACDEAVLREFGEPQTYAEGILNVCKHYTEAPLMCVSGVSGANLRKRVEAIMANHVGLRLNLANRVALTVAAIAAFVLPVVVGAMDAQQILAQNEAAAARPRFDAVSIRPCGLGVGGARGGGGGNGGNPVPAPSPGRMDLQCTPVHSLIRTAYVGQGVAPAILPVSGGPSWIRDFSDGYEISAVAAGNPSRAEMMGPMLQTLLEDRFKLKVHRETREVPLYALTVARGGVKLQPHKEGNCSKVDPSVDLAARKLAAPPWILDPNWRPCGSRVLIRQGPTVKMQAAGATLDEIAKLLGSGLNRPVVDRTGLSGLFDVEMSFANDGAMYSDGHEAPVSEALFTAPTVFTAIQEQLGLQLEPTRGPYQYLVIDSVERPSEN